MNQNSMLSDAIQIEQESLFHKTKQQKFMTIKQWVETYKCIPEGGIRHLIFSNPSFSSRVVKKLGKKILLDTQALEEWISEQQFGMHK